ncbi:Techylectin-5A [Araneus ventricosus]|uniref:Techylectin-5A n=1 Tax=Araneus ventricosus TaxID=182803 RepID=A0A4Y2SW29_ARAVE|nr:Techylectin-5A [Araneus ventricosus]
MGLVSCNSSWWGRVSWKTGTENNGTLWQEEKSDRFTVVDQLKEYLSRRDRMKKHLCCSAFFLLIFTDICSAKAVKIDAPKSQAGKGGDCSKCPKHERPMDCAELRENGVTESGVYTIYPRSRLAGCQSIDVYCDMETAGGGWTVIQRRGQYGNGEDYFVKKWKEYKEGFGNLKKEFWLGNDNIYSITNQGQYAVRMDMKHENGTSAFSRYENFWIESEESKYTLRLSECSGPGGDSIGNHAGWPFYTVDQPNQSENWTRRSGGWWRNHMKTSSLNGLNLYKTDRIDSEDGITWYDFGWFKNSLEATEIKVRLKKFH